MRVNGVETAMGRCRHDEIGIHALESLEAAMSKQVGSPPPVEPQARLLPFPQSRTTVVRARTRGRRWMLGGLVLLLLLGAAGFGLWYARSAPNVRYTSAPVTRGTVARTVVATGTVNPVLTIIVGTYVSGVIQQLSCDYNTEVKRGQVCAKIDPRPYQTVVDQSRANLEVAKAQLEKDNANLAYAKVNFDRTQRLAKTNAIAQDVADLARNAYNQAKAQIALDQATIDQRQAQLEAAEVNLGYTDIVSPVDGTVVSRNVTMGQTVAASFQTPTLFLIATDLTKMQVDTNVSESDIGGIKVGDKASFTVDAFPKRTFNGSVSQVRQSPQTVQNVVTFDVVVSVDNEDLALKPGMTASTRIVVGERDDVVRVPNQALRYVPGGLAGAMAGVGTPGTQPEQPRVWILRDGEPTAVAVTTGLDDDNYTEILEGDLKEGDRVVVGERRDTSDAGGRTNLPRLRF